MTLYRPNYNAYTDVPSGKIPLNRINTINERLTNTFQIISNNKEDIIINDGKNIKKVSKRCTHMGCILTLDDKNQKLLCPCHSSEFKLTGEVLEGPARDNLHVETIGEAFQNYENSKKLDW